MFDGISGTELYSQMLRPQHVFWVGGAVAVS